MATTPLSITTSTETSRQYPRGQRRQSNLGRVWQRWLVAIDAGTFQRITDIPLPVHPEGFQLDSASGQVFVNRPKSHTIAVVDRRSGKLASTWSITIAGDDARALHHSSCVTLGLRFNYLSRVSQLCQPSDRDIRLPGYQVQRLTAATVAIANLR